MTLGVEFTAADWAGHLERVPHAALICNGKPARKLCRGYGRDGHGLGFICRGEEHSCGRYCCACEGGSDDRCSACWLAHDKAQNKLPPHLRDEFLDSLRTATRRVLMGEA